MAGRAQNKNAATQTRIQKENRTVIRQAALDVFSSDGYRGATVDRIADRAGMSKANLLYYYRTKEEIYRTLIEDTVDEWLAPFADIDPKGNPIDELRRYITMKLRMSRDNPEASRLFANEIQRGAPLIKEFLKKRLKPLVREKANVIVTWIDQGKIAPVDPYHLIFAIWATTQHYADFEAQVDVLLDGQWRKPGGEEQTAQAVLSILLNGISPR